MTKPNLKLFLRKLAPTVYDRLQELRTKQKLNRILRAISSRRGLIVQTGPFAKMEYVPQAVGSSLIPKLVGCYEAELHHIFFEELNDNYDRVIDVGCAEGYYAVGLAIRLPKAKVFAFDVDSKARQLCAEMARLNSVADRVIIEGECRIDRLEALSGKRTLVVCDCEGCEFDLLQPEIVPGLKSSDILVELHDFVDPRITPTLIARFQPTHDITLIDSEERDPSIYDALQDFGPKDRRIAVAEFRDGKMQWAFMKARLGTLDVASDSLQATTPA